MYIHNTRLCLERLSTVAKQVEWLKLEEMDEDEYEALPEDERQRVDQKLLEVKKERLRKIRELKEQQERDRKEKELIEERRLEDEK